MGSSVASTATRIARLDESPWRLPVLAAATAAVTAVFLFLRIPYAMPLAQAAVAWPLFAASCRAGKPGRAAVAVLVFALAAAAVVTGAVAAMPADHFDRAVTRGVRYRDEMFAFLRSGGTEGEEATPALFLPQHALHFGLFVALCLATAGFGGLAMGAALLDYMSYFVGSLVAAAAAAEGNPARALLFSWAPYAIVRVAGYALAGSGLATLLLGPREARRRAAAYVALGAGLAVVDVIAKAFLARWYGETLLSALQGR